MQNIQTIIHFIIKNTEFSISVTSFESFKILKGNLKITKIKSTKSLNDEILEYWVSD